MPAPFRLLAQKDLPGLRELCHRCRDFVALVNGAPPSADDLDAWAAEILVDRPPGHPDAEKWLLGMDGPDGLVGVWDLMLGYPKPDTLFIGLFVLDPAERGAGQGRRALDRIERWAVDRGVRSIQLAVQMNNPRARVFWERAGFVHLEDRPLLGAEDPTPTTHLLEKALPPDSPMVVVPYQPDWPEAFAREHRALEEALGEVLVSAHHMGSTSVPGLAAKPVIDILLEVSGLEALDRRSGAVEALGYQAMGEFGMDGRRYFRRGVAPRTHHIHAYEAGNDEVHRHMVFPRYLRAHDDVAAAYGALKLKLGAAYANDRDAYCDAKDPFIKEHEARALAWARRG